MKRRLNDVTPEEWDAVNYYKKLDERLPDDFWDGEPDLSVVILDNWDEDRVDAIGQNGNDGLHYTELTANNAVNKYKVKLKGVEFDVYDVLYAFGVSNPAVQHAVKKLLKAGDRGFKGREQDLREAIQSIQRAMELEHGAN